MSANFQRSMLAWLTLLLAAIDFVTHAAFAGRPRAQNAQTENVQTQNIQSADSIPSLGKPDYSQEPYIIESFIMRDAFQNDGTDSADVQAVVRRAE